MTKEEFKKIIDICSKQDIVKEAVLKNHDNNLWWPIEVDDYRKRLLIAGLSTRISYNMINSFRNVINDLNSYTYEEIVDMSEEKISTIIKSLGLSNIRTKYIHSMMSFIEKYNDELLLLNNDELIKLIVTNVSGSSYKVAQCCTLYMKGYYCGVMPVDSGMKDVELPCIGFDNYKTAIGHDILRKELEDLTKNNEMLKIIDSNGYGDLNIPDSSNATWWVHLVLIYYKRCYCNKHKPEDCPLNKEVKTKCLCRK